VVHDAPWIPSALENISFITIHSSPSLSPFYRRQGDSTKFRKHRLPTAQPAMSARGARSRKVQQKDVEKKEKKIGKSKAIETIYEPQDGSVDWRKPSSASNPRNGVSRTLTVSSRTTSRSSSTNGSGNRPRLNTLYSNSSSDIRPVPSSGVGSASVSDASTKGREKTTFQANGKETKAPRGRGGGVPIKRAIDPPPAPTNYRAEYAASYPSSNQKTWLNFKTWGAGKDGMRPYSGFEYVSLTFKAVVLHLT
jgi:hypothetical protein